MAVEKVDIEAFLYLSKSHPVLDARSPGEFIQAHLPGAVSFPLFSDEERKVVGTAYKNQAREAAIKIGLEYFGVKMRRMVEEAEHIVARHKPEAAGSQSGTNELAIKHYDESAVYSSDEQGENLRSNQDANHLPTVHLLSGNGSIQTEVGKPSTATVLVHCWRGGMRSEAVAWLLSIYGFKVYLLNGGYKKFRVYVLSTFRLTFRFNILSGFTGSGKTEVLKELRRQGESVIDLEALANHKGSAFGKMGPQPTQEMFENMLAMELRSKQSGRFQQLHTAEDDTHLPIWLEDESQRIGSVLVPNDLWRQMQQSPVFILEMPFEERLNHIEQEYGREEKENLGDSILRIRKRLGGLETKTALNFLSENNKSDAFKILLKYYDTCYLKSLTARQNGIEERHMVTCSQADHLKIAGELLSRYKSIEISR